MKLNLNDSNFTIFPLSDHAVNISVAYRKKAENSIIHIIKSLESISGMDQKYVVDCIKNIVSFSTSTQFYALNTSLTQAIKEKKGIDHIKSIVEKFNNTETNSYISSMPLVRNIDSYDWSLNFANQTVKEANQIEGDHFARMQPADSINFSRNRDIVYSALAIIKSSKAYRFYDELVHYVSDIILFQGKGVTGGSSTRTMGAIYIRIPINQVVNFGSDSEISLSHLTLLIYYLEQLIHETAHLHLDQLMEFDPIVLNKPSDLYKSPIRKDPRPMRGVFHATFVLARLLNFMQLLEFDLDEQKLILNKRKKTIHKALKNGIETILEYGILSEKGKKIFEEIIEINLRG